MLRCSECKSHIIEETKYMDWLALYNFLEYLQTEEYITEDTYKNMADRLITLKPYAFGEYEKNN